jgi:signal transduction histidine kinase
MNLNMSLASRLSAFFLAALGAVLVGFSVALYFLAADHLLRLVDERLTSALATLAAAAEIGPDGVEWEPKERSLGLGSDPGPDQVRWVVCRESGQTIDASANLNPKRLAPQAPVQPSAARFVGRDGRPWRVQTRLLAYTGPSPADAATLSHSPSEPAVERRFPSLTLVAFAPLGPTEATLRRLAFTLAGLSAALWLVAAVVGRRLCQKALAPLVRMASAARGTGAAEPGARLPVIASGDELEDLGHAFNGLLDRLHEALERQRRFTGDASHQLRTPLAGLLSQVDVALRRDRPPEEYRRVLGVVRAKGSHLRQVVESLLFLARAESEAARPVPETVDLAAWVDDHLQGWSGHDRAHDLHMDASAGDRPFWVRVHPPLLAQAVDNLLDNACKYSAPGTPIALRLWRETGVAALSVEDQGCGIAEDELPHVFEPFYRSPTARRRGENGVGLGLAVARRVVAAFGGTISVQANPGLGSRFVIRLPSIAETPPLESPPPECVAMTSSPAPATGTLDHSAPR